jgi:hypothetical protein
VGPLALGDLEAPRSPQKEAQARSGCTGEALPDPSSHVPFFMDTTGLTTATLLSHELTDAAPSETDVSPETVTAIHLKPCAAV